MLSPVCYSCICALCMVYYIYSGARALENSLQTERVNCAKLDEKVTRLQIENNDFSRQTEQYKVREQELVDQNNELVCRSIYFSKFCAYF